MIINLKDISDDGLEFNFSREDTEMTDVLDDLLKGSDYMIHLRITPAGNAFDMRGEIRARLPETCSFCANDFVLPIEMKVHELLLIGMKTKCNIKGSESDFEDPNLTASNLDSYQYNLGEAMHEQIALAEPFQPICKEGCLGLCPSCGVDRNLQPCTCVAPKVKNEKQNAFSVLKELKLN